MNSESARTPPHLELNRVQFETPACAALFVQERLKISADDRPVIGVILGSGLSQAAERLQAQGGKPLAYSSIPGMPLPQVTGHAGRLVHGRINEIPVVVLQGRIHLYEGHSMESVQFGTRLLHALGVRILIVTNAAGGIRSGFAPGNLMLISSHLRPLAANGWHFSSYRSDRRFSSSPGPADNTVSKVRTPSDLLWDENLRYKASAIRTSLQIHEGVYAMMTGPNYETPAEIKAMQRLGADAVGMSTVPEALMAASLGMKVLGVSCITNIAAGLSTSSLSHTDVTATAARIEIPFTDWLWDVISSPLEFAN